MSDAVRFDQADTGGGTHDVLTFEVGGHRYGVPAADVLELVRAVTILPLPKAPAIVEGVIDLRGAIVPVLDLRARFRLPASPVAHSDHLIIASAGTRIVAIRADRALGLTSIDAGQIEPPEAIAQAVEYVAGIAKLPDGLVLIHDLRTFLSVSEAVDLDRALDHSSQTEAES